MGVGSNLDSDGQQKPEAIDPQRLQFGKQHRPTLEEYMFRLFAFEKHCLNTNKFSYPHQPVCGTEGVDSVGKHHLKAIPASEVPY